MVRVRTCNKYKIFTGLFILLCLLLFMLAGCGLESSKVPEGDPQEVIEEYYQWVMDGNYDRAYEMLANIDRDSYSKEDFSFLYYTKTVSYQLRSYRLSERERFKDKEVGFVNYSDAVKYDTAQTLFSYYEDREFTNTADGWIVGEDGEWRVCREVGVSIEEETSHAVTEIGYMYLYGKGKPLDHREAATTFRTALNYNQNNPSAHYGLGISLFDLDQYEEAIASFQIALEIYEALEDIEYRSHSLTWIGGCHEGLGNKSKAREYYINALDLYPDNQWARDGLSRVGN